MCAKFRLESKLYLNSVFGESKLIFFLKNSYHFGAVTNEGQLLTWGHYSSGALGHGSDDGERSQETPKVVEALRHMFVFAIGFGGWQSSVLAIPDSSEGDTIEETVDDDNFIRTDQ